MVDPPVTIPIACPRSLYSHVEEEAKESEDKKTKTMHMRNDKWSCLDGLLRLCGMTCHLFSPIPANRGAQPTRLTRDPRSVQQVLHEEGIEPHPGPPKLTRALYQEQHRVRMQEDESSNDEAAASKGNELATTDVQDAFAHSKEA